MRHLYSQYVKDTKDVQRVLADVIEAMGHFNVKFERETDQDKKTMYQHMVPCQLYLFLLIVTLICLVLF